MIKFLLRQRSLGKQEELKATIRGVIDERAFSTFVNDDSIPVCIIGTVDFFTGKRFYFNLKKVTYKLFLELVNASGSIPIFTPGFAFEGQLIDFEGKSSIYHKHLLYNGGMRDHSPTNKILGCNLYKGKIKNTVTIFSRPEHISQILNPADFDRRLDLMQVLSPYVEITNAEISKSDKELETMLINKYNIYDHGTIYLPAIMNHVYDITPTRLNQLYNAGRQAGNQYWIP